MKAIVTSALILSAVSTINLNALTLNEALNDALRTNPVILERLKNYDKTAYDLKIAKSEYAPTIDFVSRFGYEKTYSKHTTAGFEEKGLHIYRNSLTLTQNLFNGLATRYKIKYEKARVMAAAYNYVEKTNDVAFNVVKEYLNVLKYDRLYNLEQENILLTQDILGKTQELSDSGAGPLSDVKKVDSSLQLAEFNFLTQKNNLLDSEFNLGKLLGKKVRHVELSKPDFNYSLPTSLENATKHAVNFNPSMLVTNYNIGTAKYALDQSKSKFSPTLDFEFAYNLDKNTSGEEGHSKGYTALLVFKHNLYRGNFDVNTMRKNRLNVMQEYEIQREIKRQIIEGLQLSWSAYSMIEKQLVFLNSYQEESKATLDLYREEFEDGSRTLIDLLTAQDDYISARNKLIIAQYDWLFSKYRILDSMGEMVNSLFDDATAKYYKPVIAEYKPVSKSDEPHSFDRDGDNINDEMDLCDNTTLGLDIDMYGCSTGKEDMNKENNSSSNTHNSFKNNFFSKNDGYTLSLATFSSKKEVDRFLANSNIADNYLVIPYTTKNTNRQLYKIVSGLYDNKENAVIAMSKLSNVVKVNKPYMDNLENVKDLYFSYN